MKTLSQSILELNERGFEVTFAPYEGSTLLIRVEERKPEGGRMVELFVNLKGPRVISFELLASITLERLNREIESLGAKAELPKTCEDCGRPIRDEPHWVVDVSTSRDHPGRTLCVECHGERK